VGTVEQVFYPEEAVSISSTPARYVKTNGSSFPVTGLAFADATLESTCWKWAALRYGSGNITVDVVWYADTSTTSTHGVMWSASVAAITPGTDTQNVETKNFATSASASTDLGSTNAQKLMKTTITVTSLDSIATGDECWFQLIRLYADAADDLTGDAIVTSVRISYSDT
jgi:hypothetical protein